MDQRAEGGPGREVAEETVGRPGVVGGLGWCRRRIRRWPRPDPARRRPPDRPSRHHGGRRGRAMPGRRWPRTTTAGATGAEGAPAWPHTGPNGPLRRSGLASAPDGGGASSTTATATVPSAPATSGSKWALHVTIGGDRDSRSGERLAVDSRPVAGEQDMGQRRLVAPFHLGPPHHGLVLGPGQGHVQQAESLPGRLVGSPAGDGHRPCSSSGQSAPPDRSKVRRPVSGST